MIRMTAPWHRFPRLGERLPEECDYFLGRGYCRM